MEDALMEQAPRSQPLQRRVVEVARALSAQQLAVVVNGRLLLLLIMRLCRRSGRSNLSQNPVPVPTPLTKIESIS